MVPPAFGSILHHPARGLNIGLAEAVTNIAPKRPRVKVTTAQGTCHADHVVVTQPLGVLRRAWSALPNPLTPSASAPSTGSRFVFEQMRLRFDRMFWPADKDWIDFPRPTETLWGDWTNYLPACGPPVIVGFNAARMGDEIEALSDAATTTSAMAALRAMFGSSVPDPVAAQFSRWRANPFARGAYSFRAVGSSHKDRSALFGADRDSRLQFASKAASKGRPATVHSALLTGRATAAAILNDTRPFP